MRLESLVLATGEVTGRTSLPMVVTVPIAPYREMDCPESPVPILSSPCVALSTPSLPALSPSHQSVPLALSHFTALKSRHTPPISKTIPGGSGVERGGHGTWATAPSSLQEATLGALLTSLPEPGKETPPCHPLQALS